jgi:hypothetical protein
MTVTLGEGKHHVSVEPNCSVRAAGRYPRDPSSIPSSSDTFKAAYNTTSAQLKLKGKIEGNMDLAVKVARNSSARLPRSWGSRFSFPCIVEKGK